MSGDFAYTSKTVSPIKCNEKPWDSWVSEIGHSSPTRDDDPPSVFRAPADADRKGPSTAVRRLSEGHPYKAPERAHSRYRRSGLNRLKFDTMSLHGLFPQMDDLNAALCHMCGIAMKCSAVYRHWQDTHAASAEPILPPPPPAPTVKLKSGHSRSRHKKEPAPPPPPADHHPLAMDATPAHSSSTPLSRIVLPPPDLQYLDEAAPPATATTEVQVCVESGELPVVSIQDTDELPLGENITDDIFAIMSSEGIQSADDITNATDWKNIIRDIGNMQEMNFSQTDSMPAQDLQAPVDAPLSTYAITDADLSSLQFAPTSAPLLSTILDANIVNAQPLKPASTPTKVHPKSKSSKSKFNAREYDPNKHCGVVMVDNLKPCTRSLTCKAHTLSLRRTVEGRSKPFDVLLAEHRASRDAALAANAHPPPPAPLVPPLLVNAPLELAGFNGLTAEQQVNDIYATLLGVEDPTAALPDTSSITSLLSQPLPSDQFLLPEDAELGGDVPILSIASPPPPTSISATRPEEKPDEGPPQLVPADVCWYSSCPRPLALCTYNAAHAGGAVALGKRFATVRSNIKSSLSRSQFKGASGTGPSGTYYNFGQNCLSKSVHMNNASKAKPELRRLIASCAATGARHDPPQDTTEHTHTLNGHVEPGIAGGTTARRKRSALKSGKRTASLELGYALDSLLADEKC